MHQQNSDSPEIASVPVTALLGASGSTSNVSTGMRKVRLSDEELLRRVQQVSMPDEIVDLSELSPQRGWNHVKAGVPSCMRMCYRELPSDQTLQCQVVVSGEIRTKISELVSLLRSPNENENNALLRAMYGSRFIYSSLVHAIPNSERDSSLLSPPFHGTGNIEFSPGQQLLVRTISFVRTGLPNPFKQRSSPQVSRSYSLRSTSNSIHQHASRGKNEQCCYIELLTVTQEGFKIQFCSLDASNLTAGKAPLECVIALHPISGWFIARSIPRDPDTTQITFQAAFLGEQPGGCDPQVAQARLLFIAKGVCRLEKVLHRKLYQLQRPRSASGRVWKILTKPFRALGISKDDIFEGAHHNWHCIACTRSFLPTIRKNWQRCDLCAYRVCAEPSCCSHERVAIYSRYVAPLLVCARCRECISDHDSCNHHSATRTGTAMGENRYAGFSFRFTVDENELEPEIELNPNNRRPEQWGINGTSNTDHESSKISWKHRRTQSDPPPILDFIFSSSEYNSLSEIEQ
ncbi:hypothetical protein PHMEG_00014725 [Phytophthora megakarya]|uniref:FYVE-type domain-containing protein n=1 Tax=Phytophthora megakarya TaxID=4795 RepID=A0A225W4N6_9STRA|nr:hypothetical protein PHMEG_00014725 [Phytophthora megakarya]